MDTEYYRRLLETVGHPAGEFELNEILAHRAAGGQPRDKRECYVHGWADEDDDDLLRPAAACRI